MSCWWTACSGAARTGSRHLGSRSRAARNVTWGRHDKNTKIIARSIDNHQGLHPRISSSVYLKNHPEVVLAWLAMADLDSLPKDRSSQEPSPALIDWFASELSSPSGEKFREILRRGLRLPQEVTRITTSVSAVTASVAWVTGAHGGQPSLMGPNSWTTAGTSRTPSCRTRKTTTRSNSKDLACRKLLGAPLDRSRAHRRGPEAQAASMEVLRRIRWGRRRITRPTGGRPR